jgi:ubiquinone/menaquinone biosynthesis C-methylase UbiE
MSELVRQQYEHLPYPYRDPAKELEHGLELGVLDTLAAIDHCVFGGRWDRRKPFRALVAGGGTGDALVALAQQCADARIAAEIVYLDLSEASRAIAEQRARMRGLDNVRFVVGSLLDLANFGLGQFDFINCSGVLHHLDDPPAGLACLAGALAEGGGMAVMLYGTLGRTGVYPVQDMLRRIVPPDLPPQERLEVAKRLIAQLPASNWLRRNGGMVDYKLDDASLYDELLHSCDRAYTVREVDELARSAGLRVVTFMPPALYDPLSYVKGDVVAARAAALSPIERAQFAENWIGALKKHSFFLVAADNPVAPPSPEQDRAVPCWSVPPPLPPAGHPAVIQMVQQGLPLGVQLTPEATRIAKAIDGRTDLAGLRRVTKLPPPAFREQFAVMFRQLNAMGALYLRLPRG